MAEERSVLIQERVEAARLTLSFYYLGQRDGAGEDLYLCARCGVVATLPRRTDLPQLVITCPCCGVLNES